jgi:hypothetical protein
MTITVADRKASEWALWQKVLFRFFIIYFTLQIAPWTWLDNTIPGIHYLNEYYYRAIEWLMDIFNNALFHFNKTTIVNNGSGDTSLHWEEMLTYLTLAIMGCILWSVLDRKQKNYTKANYWLLTFLRYFLIINCISYGISKLYASQMPFPNQSQLATPLGDFLPMRLSWMFIGYSTPYQMFSGIMEIITGLLLLNRKTITLGILMGIAVFTNVMVLNLSYDIPVKLFSIHLVIYCLYLLANDSKRLLDFFVFNRPTTHNVLHHISFSKKWMRMTRIVLKLFFIVVFVGWPFYQRREFYRSVNKEVNIKPIRSGVYDVIIYAVNGDTIPALVTDTLRWKDIIFEKGGIGSVGSTDTSFRQRYRRGYFNFVPDTAQKTISFKKLQSDTHFIFTFRYELLDSNTVRLWGKRANDSLFVVIKKSNRHFQLTERQFHWISEANR